MSETERRSLTRRALLRLGAMGTLALVFLPDLARGEPVRSAGRAPRLRGLVVRSRRPFHGDRRLLATVSPGSDFRDKAFISFDLERAANVTVEAIRGGRPQLQPFWSASADLPRGRHRFTWQPGKKMAPGTYVMRLTVNGRRVYTNHGPGSPHAPRAPVVRILGLEAVFRKRSYAPGKLARLRVDADVDQLAVQIFRSGGEGANTDRPDEMKGVAMARPRRIPWSHLRHRTGTITIRLGDWPSGLYFARLIAPDGRRGYAPFIIRPKKFGAASRVLVVLPTSTWQAYNFRDANGDGWGDTWYAGGNPPVQLNRPFMNRGVPPRFRRYDLPFLRWLYQTGRNPDFISDEDLGRFDGTALARLYDLVVFPGSHRVRHEPHVHRDREVPRPRRQPDLPLGEQLLLARGAAWKQHPTGQALAKPRTTGGPPARDAVSRERRRHPAGPVPGDGRAHGSLALRGHRPLERLDARRSDRRLRDRDRLDDTGLPARDAGASPTSRTCSAKDSPPR